LKVDAEGAEIAILMGLKNTLNRINQIIMEVHLSLVSADTISQIFETHNFAIKRTRKLYENCWVMEAKRNDMHD
jgi:hypothetical protein